MSQSSKSSVTLGAVCWTLTLAGEEKRSWRSVHILNLGPNHLHLSKDLFIICVFFNSNVGFCCDLEEVHVKIFSNRMKFFTNFFILQKFLHFLPLCCSWFLIRRYTFMIPSCHFDIFKNDGKKLTIDSTRYFFCKFKDT